MRRQLRENQNEMLVHASALGLGLIYCGTYDQGLTDELFNVIDVGMMMMMMMMKGLLTLID